MLSKSTQTTCSTLETEKLGERIARTFPSGKFLLFGALGAGKTTFVRGFARALGAKEKVKSPTFVYERVLKLPKKRKLFHLDLYRVSKLTNEFEERLRELFAEDEASVIVEWSERIPRKLLPKKRVELHFHETPSGERTIRVSPHPKISLKEITRIKPSKST